MYNTSQAVSALHAQSRSSPNALTLSNIPNQKSSANLYTVGPQVKRQSVNEIQIEREEREREGRREGEVGDKREKKKKMARQGTN